jgi:Rrf2 family protein
MQLNQATDYAFRAMLHLAHLPQGSIASTQTLAESEAIPQRFLLKIMRALNQAGLIKSYRGVEGGFALARPAADISLLDIITAMEGPVAIHRCLGEREACNKHCSHECPVHATLRRLQDELVAGLGAATLAALVEQKRKSGCR